MSGPVVFHLVSSHDVVPTWTLHPRYVALCGHRVETAGVVGTECPNECEFAGTMAYCPACLSEALRVNRLAGVEAGEASTVTTRG